MPIFSIKNKLNLNIHQYLNMATHEIDQKVNLYISQQEINYRNIKVIN